MKIANHGTKIQLEFGEKWMCPCGVENAASGDYLATNWDEQLVHTCKCGIKRDIFSGALDTPDDQGNSPRSRG